MFGKLIYFHISFIIRSPICHKYAEKCFVSTSVSCLCMCKRLHDSLRSRSAVKLIIETNRSCWSYQLQLSNSVLCITEIAAYFTCVPHISSRLQQTHHNYYLFRVLTEIPLGHKSKYLCLCVPLVLVEPVVVNVLRNFQNILYSQINGDLTVPICTRQWKSEKHWAVRAIHLLFCCLMYGKCFSDQTVYAIPFFHTEAHSNSSEMYKLIPYCGRVRLYLLFYLYCCNFILMLEYSFLSRSWSLENGTNAVNWCER